MKSLGQIAYEAYFEYFKGKVFGYQMPIWEGLPAELQAGNEAGATAITAALLKGPPYPESHDIANAYECMGCRMVVYEHLNRCPRCECVETLMPIGILRIA